MAFRSCRYSVRFFFLFHYRRQSRCCCRSRYSVELLFSYSTFCGSISPPPPSSSSVSIFFLFRSLPKETFFFPLTFRCCLQPYKLLDVRMLVCIYALILYIQPISNYNSIGGNDQHTEPTTTTTTITVHLILFDRIRIRIVSWKCMTKIVGACDFDIRERSRIKIRYAV